MRRIAVLSLSAVVALGLVGCSDDDESPEESTDTRVTVPQGTVAPEFEAFCADYRDMSEGVLEATDLSDPEQAGEKTDEVRELYSALPDGAPEELVEDLETVDAAIADLDTIAEMLFITGDARDASDNITEWVILNCKFDPATLAEVD